MRKAILSIALILVFTAYTLHVRIIGADAPVVLTPEPNKGKIALTLPQYNIPTPIIPTIPEPTTTKPTITPATKPPTTPPPSPTPTPIPTPPPIINNDKYRNGSYTGDIIDAYYGYVQVKAVISGGKITDVQFLDHPQDRQTSIRINSRAMPYLTSEAIKLQDANVATVSGASFTSAAFRESLASALDQARI